MNCWGDKMKQVRSCSLLKKKLKVNISQLDIFSWMEILIYGIRNTNHPITKESRIFFNNRFLLLWALYISLDICEHSSAFIQAYIMHMLATLGSFYTFKVLEVGSELVNSESTVILGSERNGPFSACSMAQCTNLMIHVRNWQQNPPD